MRLRLKVTTMYTVKARAHRPTSTSAALTTFSVNLHAERTIEEKLTALRHGALATACRDGEMGTGWGDPGSGG